jgi:nucleoside-diphosphate-sugar epimerase
MRVLVTGSEGLVGSELQTLLRANGHEVVGYDLRQGQNILDIM